MSKFLRMVTSGENGKLVKLQNDVLASWQNHKVAKWHVGETANLCIINLAKWFAGKMAS
jgi:hypothetical protein